MSQKESNRFGSRLRWLRESYYLRITKPRSGGPMPRLRLSGLALIECLTQVGYDMSSGQYSEVESGRIIPRDIEGFLLAISSCLSLEEEMLELLRTDLAFDLVANRFGLEFAQHYVLPLTCVGQTVRRFRRQVNLTREDLARLMSEEEASFSEDKISSDQLKKRTKQLVEQLTTIEEGRDYHFESDQERLNFVTIFSHVTSDDAHNALVLARSADLWGPISPADYVARRVRSHGDTGA